MQPKTKPDRRIDISSDHHSALSINLSPVVEKPEQNEQTGRLSVSSDETLNRGVIMRTDFEDKRRSRSRRDPKSKSQEMFGKRDDKTKMK